MLWFSIVFFHPDPGDILFDLWSLHDPPVQRGQDRNGSFLHHWERYLCPSVGERRGERRGVFFGLLIIRKYENENNARLTNNISCFPDKLPGCRCVQMLVSPSGRQTPAAVPLGHDWSWNWQTPLLPLRGVKVPWSGVSFLERGWNNSFVAFMYIRFSGLVYVFMQQKQNCKTSANLCVTCFRCCLSHGGSLQVRLQSNRWSCLTWSTTQSTSPVEGALARSVLFYFKHKDISV